MPDCVFDKIVIEPGLAVLQMGTERVPLIEQVIAGFAEQRLGQHTLARPKGQPLQAFHRTSEPKREVISFNA